MAFTKTPTYNVEQQKFIPIRGSYGEDSRSPNTGWRYLNCFPKTLDQYAQDPKHVLVKRPPFEQDLTSNLTTQKAGIFRGIYTDNLYYIYAVDTTVYYGYINGSSIDTMTIPASGSYLTEVTLGLFVIPGGRLQVYCASHSKSLGLNITMRPLGPGATVSTQVGISTRKVVVLNSTMYALASAAGSSEDSFQRIYNSASGNILSWNTSSDFIDSEQFTDAIVDMQIHKNSLVVFGVDSVEFFFDNAIQLGSPLLRNEQLSSRVGGNFISCFVGDNVYFVGKNTNGVTGVFEINNFQIKKISNDYIDEFLSVSVTEPPFFTMLATKMQGDSIVFLEPTIPSNTREAYNITSKSWFTFNLLPIPNSSYIKAVATFGTSTYFYYTLGFANTISWDRFLLVDKLKTVPVSFSNVNAFWSIPNQTFETNNNKTCTSVEVIGDPGNNQVTLSYSKNINYSDRILIPNGSTLTNKKEAYRWYSLGLFKQISFVVGFLSGNDHMSVEGLEINYTVGTR